MSENEAKHFDVPADKRATIEAVRQTMVRDFSSLTQHAAHSLEGAGYISITSSKDGVKYDYERWVVCPTSLLAAIEYADSIAQCLRDIQKTLDVQNVEWHGQRS